MANKIKNFLAPLEKSRLLETLWLTSKYLLFRKKNRKIRRLSWILIKAIDVFNNRLKSIREDNSFAGEAAALKMAMNSLKIESGYLVDIGAADGILQSSTHHLLKNQVWTGTLFEYNAEAFSRLAFLYNDNNQINLAKAKVTPDNLCGLFHGFEIPKDFDFLNIDIDSYDLAVIRVLIDSGFKPRLISMEINEKIPPNLYFEVTYSSDQFAGGDHFYGCSLTAAYESLSKRGYSLFSLEYNNALFYRDESSDKSEVNLKIMYHEGYLQREDRKELFPWNNDVEPVYSLGSESAKQFFDEKFAIYKNRYILELREQYE